MATTTKDVPLAIEGAEDPLALTAEELERIKAEAAATVAKEIRAKMVKLAKDAALLAARREAGIVAPDDPPEIVSVTIDLPPFSDAIRIDQKVFMHGTTVRVPINQAITMHDMMQLAWRHENEKNGRFFSFDKRWDGGRVNTSERFH